MPLKIVRNVLVADPTTISFVGDRISPVQDQLNEEFPRIVLSGAGVNPINSLSGWAGLDRCHVQVDSWAADYTTAKAIGDAVRLAMSVAGYIALQQLEDKFQFETDVNAFRVGYVFEVWK